jgi:hypothetical protein
MDSVPEGTAEFSLGSLLGRDLLPVAGDKSSVVPAGTEFLSDQSYPGLTSWATFMPSLSGLFPIAFP